MQIPGADTRVVELRVHGILGTTDHDLTDSVASVDVAGDGIGRIVRPADRLLRPVPGPMLSAGERTVPRVVEGYAWGRMTSGGAKALWALLFPFAVVNMAHWMLPPVRSDDLVGRVVATATRALLRLVALLLTMLFVAQLTVLGLDVLAAQCLSSGSGCMGNVPGFFRELDVLRSIPTMAGIGLVALLMHRLSAASWRVLASPTEERNHSTREPSLPGNNVVTEPDTPGLRALHTVAALSTAVLLALGGPAAATNDPRWLGAAVLAGICVVCVLLLDDPTGMRPHDPRGVRALLRPFPRRLMMSAAVVLLAATAVAPPNLDGPLPGSGSTVDTLTACLAIGCALVGALVVAGARLTRSRWAHLSRELRPWAGGAVAAPVLLIGCLLGVGFGAGLALSLRRILAAPQLRLPATYETVTLLWGTTTVLLVLASIVLVPWALIAHWRGTHSDEAVPPEVALLHAGRQQDQQRAAGAWQWARLQHRYGHGLLGLVMAVLVAGVALALTLRLADMPDWWWPGWLVGLGVGGLAALAATTLRTVQLSLRWPSTARRLGVLCDLSLFWPREAHPVVPPCYALKVVPELVDRAKEHLAEPDTRVVLVGHSQGSLLAAVAAARLMDTLDESARHRVGLVTAGSQLQWGYARAFPGVVPHDSQRALSRMLEGRWRSLCRGTDPLGGAVSTWNRQVYDGQLLGVGFRCDGTEGPLPAAVRGPTSALVLGGDHWLPDPQRGPSGHRRWLPGVLGHSGYSGDPEWDRAVAMAAGLETPVRGASLPLRTPTTTSQVLTNAERPEPAAPHSHTADSLGESAGVEVTTDPEHPDAAEATAPAPHEYPDAGEAQRPAEAIPPKITEPRGSMPPWERGPALRPTTEC